MRRVPAMTKAHRFQPPVWLPGALQAIVLDVIRQEDLRLCMQRKSGPDQNARQPGKEESKGKGQRSPRKIAHVRMHPDCLPARPQIVFCVQALHETAPPGAQGVVVEPLTRAGSIWVCSAGDMAVVDKAVRAGVLAEKEGRIDRGTQTEQFAPGAVDQLVRGGMGDLTQPVAGCKKQEHSFDRWQAAVAANRPDCHGQRHQRAGGDADKEHVGSRKFGSLGRASGQRHKLVDEDDQNAHVKKGEPEPHPALQRTQKQERQRQKGGQREGDKRQRGGCAQVGGSVGHPRSLRRPRSAFQSVECRRPGLRDFPRPAKVIRWWEGQQKAGAMSFFKKLKDRMFRSSDKIGDGLEALVAEDTGRDATVPAAVGTVMPEAVVETPPLAEPQAGRQAAPQSEPEVEAARPGLLGRILGRQAPEETRRVMDDAMLESLEDLLIQADMGVDTAVRVTANIAEGRFGRRISATELRLALATEVARILEPVARPMPIYPQKPQVVLVVGVNGSGKTTTIGKLASQFKAAGKTVVIAAGDTFRAAAVEQLQIWGQRAGVPVLTAPEGSDPASLAFDALTKARADGADLLMIDTAGRLQNRADLMEELAKIVRVIRKVDPTAPHNTLLVLDATTGQNALMQVEIFRKIADVSGLVMTKLDGTAKGGVLVALADKFGLPIHAIGVGEQIDDLAPFDPDDFARALVGAADQGGKERVTP